MRLGVTIPNVVALAVDHRYDARTGPSSCTVGNPPRLAHRPWLQPGRPRRDRSLAFPRQP